MADLNQLLKKRRSQKATLARALTVINKHEKKTPVLSLGGIKTQLNLLSEASKKMDQIHDDIMCLCEDESEMKVHEKVLDEFIEQYCDVNSRLLEAEAALNPTSSNSSSQNAFEASNVQIKLPPMELPSFNGNYSNWTSFKDLFEAAVNSKNIPKAQKLQYLTSALVDDASSLLRSLKIADTNYDVAMKLLSDRYENKRKIVQSYFSKLLSQPSVGPSHSFRKFVDVVNECITGLDALVCDKEKQRDALLIYLLIDKMDSESRTEYIHDLGNTELQSFEEFRKVINARACALDEINGFTPVTQHHQNPSNSSQRNSQRGNRGNKYSRSRNSEGKSSEVSAFVASNETSTKCIVCKEEHFLFKCSTFLKLDDHQRKKCILDNRLCTNCFRNNHFAKQCKSKFTCRECHQRHHSLLHNAMIQQQPKAPNQNVNSSSKHESVNMNSESSVSVHHTSGQQRDTQLVLETAIVYLHNNLNQRIPCRALLDRGSKAFLITDECVRKLGIKRKQRHANIFGVGNQQTATIREAVAITMSSCIHREFKTTFEALVLPQITGTEPTHTFNPVQWPQINSIELADPEYNKPGKIDILLNIKLLNQIWIDGRMEDPNGLFVLQNSKLGWIFSGEASISSSLPSHLTVMNARVELNEAVKQFWEIEEMPEKNSTPSEVDVAVNSHFISTHTRDSSGRFVVQLPFKSSLSSPIQEEVTSISSDLPLRIPTMGETSQEGSHSSSKPLILGESRQTAIAMLRSQERRFVSNPSLKVQYIEFMREYLQMGHMEIIPTSEISISPHLHYYIPHHSVLKPSSTTTKLRVVFNASKKTTTGVSLNDILCVGPNNLQDIFSLFIQFRIYIVPVIGDIEKYYRQPRVYHPHTNYQRIVWREDTTQPIQDYRLLTPTYGTGPASFLTNACRRQLAFEGRKKYDIGSSIVHDRFYADDLTAGADNVKNAIKMVKEVISLLQEGCFPLRKIASSYPEVLQAIPPELRASSDPRVLLHDDLIKTLGILWHPKEDIFTFSLSLPDNDNVVTRRTVLSAIAKVYDFASWISPVTIVGKIIMQSLWKEESQVNGWDVPVSPEINKMWREYCSQLSLLSEIKINRCITAPLASQYQLHGFSDASEKAYAAVVFLRSKGNDGVIIVNMIAAKTKVAPIKKLTIPRLELCGALLLTRLMKVVKESMDLKIDEIHCWTDSSVALYWIHGNADRWKQFVSNRVTEIKSQSSFNWHHVRGEDNPADCASRGISATELKNHPLWWHGPIWLSHPQINYTSKFPLPVDQELELKKIITCHLIKMEDTLLLKYSKLSKLIFITACCLRFIFNCKNQPENRQKGGISQVDRQQALHHWIKYVQALEFSDEMRQLKKNKFVNIKSALASLSPFIDSNGIIRLGGRLRNLDASIDKKHPILLPKTNFLTILIIRECHENNFHAGQKLLTATIRQRYWIVRGQDVINQFVKKCVTCIRYRGDNIQPSMGHLPSARVNSSHPFLHTGVDYAGPIELRGRNGRGHFTHKGYIGVFICLATKAVHLEIVSDLSTPAFISTLRRFIARRGKPSHMYSDKGTNFQGADAEFKRSILEKQQKNHDSIVTKILDQQGITWNFNPPASPHMGGLWEAAVKSTKTFLKKFNVNESFTFEEMATILCQIEACLNSRPLSQLSGDPNDLEALTPGHFLIGRPLNSIPDPSSEIILLKKNNIQRWVDVQDQVNRFWNQWKGEYILELQQRFKWRRSSSQVKIDDKVILKSQLPPAHWKIARVIKVHPGPDGIIRKITVRSNNHDLKVSVINVCPLPIE